MPEQGFFQRCALRCRMRLDDHPLRRRRRRFSRLAKHAIEFRKTAGRMAGSLCREGQQDGGSNRQNESGSAETVFHRGERQSNRKATTEGLGASDRKLFTCLVLWLLPKRGIRIVSGVGCAETRQQICDLIGRPIVTCDATELYKTMFQHETDVQDWNIVKRSAKPLKNQLVLSRASPQERIAPRRGEVHHEYGEDDRTGWRE